MSMSVLNVLRSVAQLSKGFWWGPHAARAWMLTGVVQERALRNVCNQRCAQPSPRSVLWSAIRSQPEKLGVRVFVRMGRLTGWTRMRAAMARRPKAPAT